MFYLSDLLYWHWTSSNAEAQPEPLCVSAFSTPFEAYYPITSLRTDVDSVESSITYKSFQPTTVTVGTNNITTYNFVGPKTFFSSGWAIAGGLKVAWEMSDFTTAFPLEYASSLAKQMNITLVSSTSSNTPESNTPESNSTISPQTGLTKGSIAGIAVGAVAGAIMIGALILFILHKRYKARKANLSRESENSGTDHDLKSKKWYLGGRWRSEADPSNERNELDAPHGDRELDATNERRELDSRAVYVVPGPPAELDTTTVSKEGKDGE